jgi:ABC-type branched-subunit amino acid transport system ATPase component/ABC-type branched-subunit amino acid transport system permease subunit
LTVITVHGWDISWYMLISGFGQGLAYAALAAGIILIYRASGIINFAQGALGVFGLALMADLLGFAHMPFLPALVLTAIGTAAVGAIAELVFVRRLFTAPRLVLLLATLGIAQVITIAAIALPDLEVGGPFPTLVPWTWTINDSLILQPRDISVFIGAPMLILLLSVFLTQTRAGLMIRASASNPDKSRMNGIRVRRSSTLVWAIAGAFAGVTAVLLGPLQSLSLSGATNLPSTGSGGYELLLRALLVALIARMGRLPLCILGGLVVGVVETLLLNNVDPTDYQSVYLAGFVGVFILVFTFRKVAGGPEEQAFKVAAKVKPLPERVKAVWWMRHLPKLSMALVVLLLAVVPIVFHQPSELFSWSRVLIFALIGCSLTVLTGWAGQLSLGQFGFAAVGALTTMTLVQGNEIPVPFGIWEMHWHAPWAVAVVISMLAGTVCALLVGIPALRIPGLHLAITSLAFSVFVSQYVLSRPVFLPDAGYYEPLPKPVILGIDFDNRRSYYYLCLALLIVTLLVVAQLRRTGIGRSIVAVRANEPSAAALTLSPVRMKLLAFGLSGALSALAGSLLMTLLVTADPTNTFKPEESIRVVAIAVIGGLGTIAGPVLGALWIVGIPAMTGGSVATNLFVSSIGLLILLMYFPGGLVQLGYTARDALARYVADRLPESTERQRKDAAVPKRAEFIAHDVGDGEHWLRTTDVRVKFGGRVAVDGVSINVKPREFVGLIGTNGAGKSTLMNAIGGFVPCRGTVEVLGHDVNHLAPPSRHRLGMGRSFQAARLFDDLTVRETILVALESREKSMFLPSLFCLPPSPASERRKRSEADEVISYLGLGRFADEFISNLSTGTRRITELATQLAVGPRVLLLDEPTGGLAQRETEAFGPLIKQIQHELDAAVLFIEHDMPLVMSISDRVYCLEAGAVIAEGTPEDVRFDPKVVASYLGTDERTIQRSNAPLGAQEPAEHVKA